MMKWNGLVLAALLLLGIGWWAMGPTHFTPERGSGPGGRVEVEVGKILPDLTLMPLAGEQKVLSQLFQGRLKVVMLTFWASWCETCLEEMPSMVTLYRRHQKDGFEIVAVNLDENSEQSVARIQKQLEIPFPIFKDPDGHLADTFDIQAIPLTVVLSRTREVLMIANGGRDWNADSFHHQLQGWLSQ